MGRSVLSLKREREKKAEKEYRKQLIKRYTEQVAEEEQARPLDMLFARR